jgi:hypothetical protein
MVWRNSENNIPDWPEVGHKIEMEMESGIVIIGKIEGDTIEDELVISIIDSNGQDLSFFDSVKWRLLD